MSEELKLCPFCGSTPRPEWYGNKVDVFCDNDKCPAMSVNIGGLPYSDAIKAWNTRPIEDALRARNKELRDDYAILAAFFAIAKAYLNTIAHATPDKYSLEGVNEIANEALEKIVGWKDGAVFAKQEGEK